MNPRLIGTSILLLASLAQAGGQQCLEYYGRSASMIQRLNNALNAKPNSSAIMEVTRFLDAETQVIEAEFAKILNRVTSVGTNNKLTVLLETADNFLTLANEKIEQMSGLINKKKQSSELARKVGEDLKNCYLKLTMCRASLKEEVEQIELFLKELEQFETLTQNTKRQIENLEKQLDQLDQKYSSHSSQFSNFISTRADTLSSKILILDGLLSEITERLQLSALMIGQSIPLTEKEILILESRGINIGAFAIYLNKDQKETSPVEIKKPYLEVQRNVKNGSLNPLMHTESGTKFLEVLETNPRDSDFVTKKFMEIMSSGRAWKRISALDGVKIFNKMQELGLSFNENSFGIDVVVRPTNAEEVRRYIWNGYAEDIGLHAQSHERWLARSKVKKQIPNLLEVKFSIYDNISFTTSAFLKKEQGASFSHYKQLVNEKIYPALKNFAFLGFFIGDNGSYHFSRHVEAYFNSKAAENRTLIQELKEQPKTVWWGKESTVRSEQLEEAQIQIAVNTVANGLLREMGTKVRLVSIHAVILFGERVSIND